MPELPPYPGTPRWVKVTGVIAAAFVLLFVILMHAGIVGRHGPGLHGMHGDHVPPANAAGHMHDHR
jgi:hypothetical protein